MTAPSWAKLGDVKRDEQSCCLYVQFQTQRLSDVCSGFVVRSAGRHTVGPFEISQSRKSRGKGGYKGAWSSGAEIHHRCQIHSFRVGSLCPPLNSSSTTVDWIHVSPDGTCLVLHFVLFNFLPAVWCLHVMSRLSNNPHHANNEINKFNLHVAIPLSFTMLAFSLSPPCPMLFKLRSTLNLI